nr:glycoprotein precursor [Barleria severe mosaic virus]
MKQHIIIYCLLLLIFGIESNPALPKQISNGASIGLSNEVESNSVVTDLMPESDPSAENKQSNCLTFKRKECFIKGKTSFNYYYQVKNKNTLVSCISDDENLLQSCRSKLTKSNLLNVPVMPITSNFNKRNLEVGQKYFYIGNEQTKFNLQQGLGMDKGTVQKLSVRFSGDCKIEKVSLAKPYQIKLSTNDSLIGYAIKKIGSTDINIKTFTSNTMVNLMEENLDGNHVLLCGDKQSLIPKVDIATKNCIRTYSSSSYQQYMCTHFSILRFLIVAVICYFPVTWVLKKTKDKAFLWYDVLGLILYPFLYLINIFWKRNPFQCSICGSLVLINHKCDFKCICNQSKGKEDHRKDCPLYSFNKFNSLNSFEKFHLIVNSKISFEILLIVTRIIVGVILLSMVPTTIAAGYKCVSKCHTFPNCSLFLPSTTTNCRSELYSEKCVCRLDYKNDKIIAYEEVYNGDVIIQNKKKELKCLYNYTNPECQLKITNVMEKVIACSVGCKMYDLIMSRPLLKENVYEGKLLNLDSNLLLSAKRMRENHIDSLDQLRVFDNIYLKPLIGYDTLLTSQIPPESIFSRQSLVFNSQIGNKYRYLIELDIKPSTGYVYQLNENKFSKGKDIKIWIESIKVDYQLRYLYTTAPIENTHTDFLSKCTGNCDDCWKEKKTYLDYHQFCITPSSYWGCEELGCLAINEGSICGSCANIYDLSESLDVYEITRSDVNALLCTDFLTGYECKTYSDRVPYSTDLIQLNMNIDLHNDNVNIGMRVAIDKSYNMYKGSITAKNDPTLSFGHPQLDKNGLPTFMQKTLNSEQLTWECSAIGSKSVLIKKCGYDTYHFKSALEQVNDKPIKMINENSLSIEKDFSVGKLKLVLDLPSEIFKTASKKPSLSIISSKCIGCFECFSGMSCNLKLTSDMTYSSKIYWEGCTSKSSNMNILKGFNDLNFIVYCNKESKDVSLELIPEDAETFKEVFNIKDFEIVQQESIIDHNDETANQEQKHHADTTAWSFFDYIKAPFNWIASFFGVFFDFVRMALIILAAVLLIWFLSFIYKISKDYYRYNIKSGSRKIVLDNDVAELEKEALYVKNANRLKRRSPPKMLSDTLVI